MSTASASNLAINPQRLWDSLMETARIGCALKAGCSVALSSTFTYATIVVCDYDPPGNWLDGNGGYSNYLLSVLPAVSGTMRAPLPHLRGYMDGLKEGGREGGMSGWMESSRNALHGVSCTLQTWQHRHLSPAVGLLVSAVPWCTVAPVQPAHSGAWCFLCASPATRHVAAAVLDEQGRCLQCPESARLTPAPCRGTVVDAATCTAMCRPPSTRRLLIGVADRCHTL